MNALLSGVDAVLLSRLQFGFTITFHILFPALSIGLSAFLVVLEILWLRTRDTTYWRLLRFWTTIFALSFGMGVVSGLVLAYQFGTNWSGLMARAGQIMGPLLSYETMTAFFLEASFLGILLFGWRRVSPATHCVATTMVALGTCISAFWIMASNSWMQTPAGYVTRGLVLEPADWLAIIFNPSFLPRYAHMLAAALLATAFLVAGTAAWYLLRNRFGDVARPMLRLALLMIMALAPVQAVIGDRVGLKVGEFQPAKLAAIEAQWETDVMPLRLFAWPDQTQERNRFELAIPRLGSLIDEHSWTRPVRGLKEFAPLDRPPVALVFWSFRVMVSLGLAMIAVAVAAFVLWWRGRLFDHRAFLRLLVAMSPSGFVALLAGWYTAEIGRQPYVVYGLLRTADALAPVTVSAVTASLALFVVVYVAVFGSGIGYMLQAIRRGPVEVALPDQPGLGHRPMVAFSEARIADREARS